MQVTCSCGKVLNVPEMLAGKTARCPACKKTLQVPGAAPAGPAASRIMMECSCGQKLAVPAASAGKKVLCPKCRKELTVPGPAKKPSSVPPGPASAEAGERGAPGITPVQGPASYAAAPARPRKPAAAPAEALSFDIEAPLPEPPQPKQSPTDLAGGDAEKAEYGLGRPRCPNCKAELPHAAQFCVECGTALATGAKIKTATSGKKTRRKLSDLDSQDWKKIIYGVIAAIVLFLAFRYLYSPHGMSEEEMRQAAKASRMPPGFQQGGGSAYKKASD